MSVGSDYFKELAAIEKLKAGQRMFVEQYLKTVDVCVMAFRGTFVINGAAAVALYTYDASLTTPLIFWVVGAAFAVAAALSVALSCFFASETWRHFIFSATPQTCLDKNNRKRVVCIWSTAISIIASIGFFIGGLVFFVYFKIP